MVGQTREAEDDDEGSSISVPRAILLLAARSIEGQSPDPCSSIGVRGRIGRWAPIGGWRECLNDVGEGSARSKW